MVRMMMNRVENQGVKEGCRGFNEVDGSCYQ